MKIIPRILLSAVLLTGVGAIDTVATDYYRVAVSNQALVDQLKPSDATAIEVNAVARETPLKFIHGALSGVALVLLFALWVGPVTRALSSSAPTRD